MVGLDCSLLMNAKVWEASGHVGGFSDPMVDDRETRARYRADQLAVYALEFVGSDGTSSDIDDVLFAAPGEVGKYRARRSCSSRIEAHRRAAKGPAGPGTLRVAVTRTRCRTRRCARRCSHRALGARHADGAARVQSDVQDARRRARRQLERDVPAARDRAGHLRQFQERLRHGARARAVRNRPDRQSVSQRDQSSQLHFPQPRVRADGDRVLLPPRGAPQWYQYWRERRFAWYIEPRNEARRTCTCASTSKSSSRTTPRAAPTSSTTFRSAAASSRASRTAPTSICASTCR